MKSKTSVKAGSKLWIKKIKTRVKAGMAKYEIQDIDGQIEEE